jgi:hypothetical protein
MARLLTNPHQIRWMLLLTLLTPVFVAPIYSQSAKSDSISEPKPAANLSPQEPTPPQAAEAKADNPTPATPEQLRMAQIEADTKQLYQLSAELRAEVFKTYRESLSLTVLKKAEQLEKLAKNLKVLMSREAAANR